MDVSKYTLRISGEEGYLVEGKEEEKDDFLSGLDEVVNFDYQFINSDVVRGRGDLFITFSDPMEELIGMIIMETLRDLGDNKIHLTSNTEEQL